MARRYEVQTAMNALITNRQLPIHFRLRIEILFVFALDMLNDGRPAVRVVDRVAKSGRVDYSQLQIDALLRQHHWRRVHKGRSLSTLECARKLGRAVQLGQKERVDERRLAEARLADHHQIEFEAFLNRLPVDLIGQVGEADVAVESARFRRSRRRRPILDCLRHNAIARRRRRRSRAIVVSVGWDYIQGWLFGFVLRRLELLYVLIVVAGAPVCVVERRDQGRFVRD